METRSRTSTTVFDASPASLAKTQRPPSASDSGLNNSTSQVKASNETLASNEPPLDPTDPNANKTIYDFQVLSCYHELYDLSQHKGAVVLICNVASKDKEYTEWGYTMLAKLYHKYRHEGFVVLAFPCNEFANAEPGNEDEIAENISCVYPRIGEIDFPMMAKVEVNGDHALPLFGYLKSRIRGTLGQTSVKWNFTMFLVDQQGLPYARFAPGVTQGEVEARVEELLHPRPPTAPPAAEEPEEVAETAAPSPNSADAAAVVMAAALASNLNVAEKAPVEDTPTPDDFSGCATPPPSEVEQLKANGSATKTNTLTVTDVTSRGSPGVEEESTAEPDSALNNGSSSALFDATTNTLEGADL